MAEVLAFPLARRRDLVWRQAARFTELSHQAAERNLAQQVDLQRVTLCRKGIPLDVVEAECRALEGAIRAEVWRLVLTPGGAA